MNNSKQNWLHKVIHRLYQGTQFASEDRLNSLQLSQPLFYKPSVDASLLFDWHFELSSAMPPYFPGELANALSCSVVTQTEEVEEFDFANIKSLSSSKSFGTSWLGRINGSWFADAASWGAAMYPSSKLSALDDTDWESNIWYIENKEGFVPTSSPVRVIYYEWLDRYQAVQSGGSHHTAMVIHQIINQRRRYSRKAVVKRHSVNSVSLANLRQRYCMFVTGEEVYAPSLSIENLKVDEVFQEYIANKVYTLPIKRSVNRAIMCFIPYHELKIGSGLWENWYRTQVERKNFIPLTDLMDNTLKYCKTPYLHEIEQCYLGDPFRVNDKIAKSISKEI